MSKKPETKLDPKDVPHEGHAAAEALADKAAQATAEKARHGEEIAEGAESIATKAAELRKLSDEELVAVADEAARANHWLDIARRAQAELDNTIKRLRRDQEDASRYANTGLARDLLPVLDNLSRALTVAEVSRDFDGLFKGISLTSKMFTEALARHYITPVEAAGKPFDPAHHDAVMMANDPMLADNVVVQEFERGWMLHERVLRASKVSVNKKS